MPYLFSAAQIERAKELISYDPENGLFTWLESRGRVSKGQVAGVATEGYISIRVDGHIVRGHRLAFVLMTGRNPSGEIDHINGVGTDNRWVNLRDCSRAINARNARMFSHNKSGVCGVFWNTEKQKWTSHIKVNQKSIHLGHFSDFDMAVKARLAAEPKYGFTLRHGK